MKARICARATGGCGVRHSSGRKARCSPAQHANTIERCGGAARAHLNQLLVHQPWLPGACDSNLSGPSSACPAAGEPRESGSTHQGHGQHHERESCAGRGPNANSLETAAQPSAPERGEARPIALHGASDRSGRQSVAQLFRPRQPSGECAATAPGPALGLLVRPLLAVPMRAGAGSHPRQSKLQLSVSQHGCTLPSTSPGVASPPWRKCSVSRRSSWVWLLPAALLQCRPTQHREAGQTSATAQVLLFAGLGLGRRIPGEHRLATTCALLSSAQFLFAGVSLP